MARDVKAGVKITGKDNSKSAFESLSRSVSKAENKFSALKKSMSGFTGGLKMAGGILGGAAAAIGGSLLAVGIGTVRMAQSTATAIDELAKFSRQTGFNIENLQEFEFAAMRNGLAISDLRTGIVKMGKNLADLAQGSGQAKTALEKLDRPLLKQIKGAKSNAEAFDIWVKRMSETDDAAKRSAITFALFGKTGQKMLRLLDGGPEALAALREEARKYGVVTEEDAAKSEAFADAQENMTAAVTGLKNAVAVGIMPALTEAAQKMADFIAAHRPDIVRMTSGLMNSMGETITNLIDYLTKNPDALKNFMQGAVDAAKSVVDEIKDIKTFVEDVQGFFGGPDRRDRALAKAGTGIVYGQATETGNVKGAGGAISAGIGAAKQVYKSAGANAAIGPGILYYGGDAIIEGVKAAIKSQKVELVVKMPHGLQFASGKSDPNVEVTQAESYFDPGSYE